MKYWLQVAAYSVALFVAFEVLCRLFIGHAPATRFDPRFDRITRPDQPLVQSSEGFSRGRTNELGHVDAAMPDPVPADGILVMGDSYTEGRQVAREDRFTDRLGALLHRRVYNVGHTGWSPVNALAFLEAEKDRFRPATVIVQTSPNDLGDVVGTKRPHVTRGATGFEIVIPKREKSGISARISSLRESVSARSAFAGQLVIATAALFGGKDVEADGGEPATCATPTPRQIEAMDWLVGRLRHAHPDVRLVYLPRLDYHAGCVDRCTATRRMYELIAAARGVPLIDVTGAMCERFAETRQPLHGFWNSAPDSGHINARGHDVVARELAKELTRR